MTPNSRSGSDGTTARNNAPVVHNGLRRRVLPGRTPLALAFAALLLAGHGQVLATPFPVTNCADAGTRSLRAAIDAAADGDTLDLSQLGCSRITQTTGAFHVAVPNLTIIGPAAGLTIDHDYNAPNDRLLNHTGNGNLVLSDVSFTHGYAGSTLSDIGGGCVYSAGNVHLTRSRIASCRALVDSPFSSTAAGGGIFTRGTLELTSSTVAYNIATSSYGPGLGGGVFAAGTFSAENSTISANYVAGDLDSSGINARGAGLYLEGNWEIDNSTIWNNHSSDIGAGLTAVGGGFGTLLNSTVSGNSADVAVGGVFVENGTLYLKHATVALNSDGGGKVSSFALAAGVGALGYNSTIAVKMYSTLITGNFSGTVSASDFLMDSTRTLGSGSLLGGVANQVLAPLSAVPPDTLSGSSACARLGPLRNNGGPTLTHALASRSTAIDHGDSSSTMTAQDQRGSPYQRSVGSKPDIGAYEVQHDSIFNSGFEGCQ